MSPRLLIGSHLDTVPNARCGAYDGILASTCQQLRPRRPSMASSLSLRDRKLSASRKKKVVRFGRALIAQLVH